MFYIALDFLELHKSFSRLTSVYRAINHQSAVSLVICVVTFNLHVFLHSSVVKIKLI